MSDVVAKANNEIKGKTKGGQDDAEVQLKY